MKRPTRLEPQILDYLKEFRVCKKDLLVEYLHEKTGVSKDKIITRIEKMIKRGKITSIANLLYFEDPTKIKYNTDFDEKFDLGPVRLTRKGNVVSLQSKWEDKEYEKFKKTIEESLPELKQEVEDGFKQIEKTIISNYDPLNVLATISAKNSFLDPSIDTESSFQGKQLFTETIQNIVLKNEYEDYTHIDKKEDPSPIVELLKKIDGLFFNYLSSELLVKPDFTPVEKDVFFRVLHTFLIIRGDAYPVHYKEISLELFDKINDVLKEKGFTIEEYWETVEEIKNQIENNYNEPIQMVKEEHAKFLKIVDHVDNKGKSPKEIIELYRKDQETRREEIEAKTKKLSEILLKESFEIQINDKINVPLLELLSKEFGENADWQSPLDMSEVPIKPIIRLNEKYYCFIIEHLIRNCIPIIESLLTEPEKDKLEYSKIKGDYFEEKTLFILGELVDGKSYHSLQYPKRTEIDGIVVKDDVIFLVEVKGKKRRVIAGAEDILSLTKEDFEAHIGGAFNQTKRAYDYIYSKDEVEFRNSEGKTVLKLRKEDISRIYLVTVSLSSFSELSLDLDLVKKWDPQLIVGEEYPWIVNIYDLMVIYDIFEKGNPSFIEYLNQRIEIVKTNDLKAIDELDFLGYFLDYGNLTKTENIRKIQSPMIHGFSEKIDKWYYYLSGYIEEAEKPVFSM